MRLRNLALTGLLCLMGYAPAALAAFDCQVGGYSDTEAHAHTACNADKGSTCGANSSEVAPTPCSLPAGVSDGWMWGPGSGACAPGDVCYRHFYYFTSGVCPSPTTYNATTHLCEEPDAEDSTPDDTTPSDDNCSTRTGHEYKRITGWENPLVIPNCSPTGCALSAPSIDTSSAVIVVYTFTYTGQNCADHSVPHDNVPDLTAPQYTKNTQETTTTTEVDPDTGEVTTVTTRQTNTTTTTSGGETQALIDAIAGIEGGTGGASAGDIGTAVGDALEDPDNEDKPEVGDFAGDVEGIIGGTEDAMDAYADTVGEGLGDGTDGGGWSSNMAGLVPSYSCSDYTMTVHGISVELQCADTVLLRQILGWFVYAGTVAALFYLVTERPTA